MHPGSFADTKSRNEVWSAVETWSSYIRSGDVGQYRDCYSDRLTRFYNHTNVSSDEAEQMILGQMKKYSIRELTVSNPSFQDVGEGSLQVDYDKEYRFSGAGVRVNQGKVKASQVLKRAEAGTWKITAEFDREICWSTQMRDPARQSPPGTCP